MTRGVSIHVGLDILRDDHYKINGQRMFEPLDGCVKDALLMRKIAKSRGFETELFISRPDPEAPDAHTSPAELKAEFIFDRIRFHAGKLEKNDVFLMTFSGHGGQITNFNGDPEPEGFDQTWCMHNRMVIDDELAQLWSLFAPEVKIILISDSCHSETVSASSIRRRALSFGVRAFNRVIDALPLNEAFVRRLRVEPPGKIRRLRDGGSLTVFNRHRVPLYKDILDKLAHDLEVKNQTLPPEKKMKSFSELVTASLIIISACKDGEIARDGINNGVFTGALKKIWFGTDSPEAAQEGIFEGNYSAFFQEVRPLTHQRNNSQDPQFFPEPFDADLETFPLINKTHLKDFMDSKIFKL